TTLLTVPWALPVRRSVPVALPVTTVLSDPVAQRAIGFFLLLAAHVVSSEIFRCLADPTRDVPVVPGLNFPAVRHSNANQTNSPFVTATPVIVTLASVSAASTTWASCLTAPGTSSSPESVIIAKSTLPVKASDSLTCKTSTVPVAFTSSRLANGISAVATMAAAEPSPSCPTRTAIYYPTPDSSEAQRHDTRHLRVGRALCDS